MGDKQAHEIIVAGAGPAGLAAACLLAQHGVQVICLSGKPTDKQPDPRTVALMLPSIRLLSHIGVWPGALRDVAAPLRKLRLIDDTGNLLAAPTVTFGADEIGEAAFGWNIPVDSLVAALHDRAIKMGVNLIPDHANAFNANAHEATVLLKDGNALTGQLVIAADGRASRIRTTAGIHTVDWSYDQTAIATSFDHSAAHHGISSEFHKSAGPFTTVPMPDNRSSLVWMETPVRAADLMAMPDTEFAKQLQLESHGELGLISNTGPRKSFPMRGLTASVFARNRLLLVGEAAHVVPPIGALGLNMSLRDAALAAQMVGDALKFGDDPGGGKVIKAYDAKRRRDVLPRQAVVHTLNSSLLSNLAPIHTLRALGLTAISQIAPLRASVVREGLAPHSGLPRIMLAR